MRGTTFAMLLALGTAPAVAGPQGDTGDLDDIRQWEMVRMETCLDAALDRVPGHPRKLEFKLEEGEPVYEFDVEAADGNTYNVECSAVTGLVGEVEREVAADDPLFRSLARISLEEARKRALAVHPGKVIASEREIGDTGRATYEFDIQTTLGPEVKVDVDAASGEIEEANVELYEIGPEQE